MNNLIVCFPGGAGGHFIAAIASHLLHGTKVSIDKKGSVHSFECNSYLSGRLLNDSLESFLHEWADIDRLPDFDLAVAHFRNIVHLVKKDKRVIYITIEKDDIESLSKKLKFKLSEIISLETYNILKGSDWPSYEDYCDSDLHDIIGLKERFFENWYYTVPTNDDNILELTYKEITGTTQWIDKLISFLSKDDICDFNKTSAISIINKYQKINNNLYK